MEQPEFPTEGEPINNDQETDEEVQAPTTMESLLEQEDLGLDFPRPGEIRTGIIVSISSEEILVSVGTKSEGVIPKKELEQIRDDDKQPMLIKVLAKNILSEK